MIFGKSTVAIAYSLGWFTTRSSIAAQGDDSTTDEIRSGITHRLLNYMISIMI